MKKIINRILKHPAFVPTILVICGSIGGGAGVEYFTPDAVVAPPAATQPSGLELRLLDIESRIEALDQALKDHDAS